MRFAPTREEYEEFWSWFRSHLPLRYANQECPGASRRRFVSTPSTRCRGSLGIDEEGRVEPTLQNPTSRSAPGALEHRRATQTGQHAAPKRDRAAQRRDRTTRKRWNPQERCRIHEKRSSGRNRSDSSTPAKQGASADASDGEGSGSPLTATDPPRVISSPCRPRVRPTSVASWE